MDTLFVFLALSLLSATQGQLEDNLPPYFVERLPEELLVAVVPGTNELFTYKSPMAVDPEGTVVQMEFQWETPVADTTSFESLRAYPQDDATFVIDASSFTPEGNYTLLVVL